MHGVKIEQTVMAMSYYPKEGMPMWDQFSAAVPIPSSSTQRWYSPTYPVAISMNGPSMNGVSNAILNGRDPEDGTYDEENHGDIRRMDSSPSSFTKWDTTGF